MGISDDRKTLLSLNELKTILNSIDSSLYVSDIQTDEILFVNDKMKEDFNLGDEAVGSICWKVLRSGSGKRCDFCPIHRLLKNHATPVIWEDYNAVTNRYYKKIDRVIEWPNGKMVHLQHSTDITDTKLAEVSLKRRLEQQRLMSIISQSFTTTLDMQYLICDALKTAGMFMGANQAVLSKYRQEENCLECLYEWYDEGGQPYIGGESRWPFTQDMKIYRDLTIKGYAAIDDFFLLTHPNFQTVSHYRLRAFLNIPIKISGKLWGILGFIINERRYEWSESDIHLGKLIAGVFSGAISRNIAEENLFQAKETAEQASRSKGEFLSRMSHEMRTPINAITGMTWIARNSGDPKKMEYCLERIDTASKHLLGLINDILDMSKIEANKFELSSTEFDFERMLVNVTGVVNFRIEEKKQNLIINMDQNIPPVLIGDEMRLSQIIVNLLSNSVKFAPEEGVIILNARLADVSDDMLTLLFEVIDNGIGISKEQQTRLFAPFEQADGGIARKYGGTGLGLTISKGIVELMGGQIWIESELGQGATFRFTVKMQMGKGFPRTELADTVDKNRVNILAVEGVPEIRDYFSRAMSELGLLCDIADSGSKALEMIRGKKDGPYNLVFIDWSMPGLDGFELARKIKRITNGSAVIMMISETDWGNIEKSAVSASVDKFVFKPLFPSALIGAINESFGTVPAVKAVPHKTREYNFKGHTLLVAEDIEINREILFAVLENTKIWIDFAQDGVEALSMVERNPERYSLILMDIHMPEMDGYEATRKIRTLDNAEGRQIPIIAMTASVFQEDIERCIRAGMNDHIAKPVDAEVLLSKLDQYLHAQPAVTDEKDLSLESRPVSYR